MAIEYVGGQVLSRPGSNSSITRTFALTGGIDTVPRENDLVIILSSVASQGRNTAQAITTPSGYTALGQLNEATDAYDSSMNISWKIMGATPDTTFDSPSTGSTQDAQVNTIQVFRGIDLITPFDVTAVSATGINSDRPDPGSITPITTDSFIVICGAGANNSTGVLTAPTGYTTNFIAGSRNDTNDCTAGSGYKAWVSGAEDPGQYGGSSGAITASWTAYTLVIRPSLNGDDNNNALAMCNF